MQPSGQVFRRGGNSAGWNGSWRVLMDNYNYSNYALSCIGRNISALPSDYNSFLFSTDSDNIDTNIGAWSKGILMTGGGWDAGLISVDSSKNLTWGYRANGNWLGTYKLGANKVLWSGGHIMTADQTAYLSESISSQVNGIVLMFSLYDENTGAIGQTFNYAFAPKYFVSALSGQSSCFQMASSQYGNIGFKMLYINDTQIIGHSSNTGSGTTNGVTYNNWRWILRYIIGI